MTLTETEALALRWLVDESIRIDRDVVPCCARQAGAPMSSFVALVRHGLLVRRRRIIGGWAFSLSYRGVCEAQRRGWLPTPKMVMAPGTDDRRMAEAWSTDLVVQRTYRDDGPMLMRRILAYASTLENRLARVLEEDGREDVRIDDLAVPLLSSDSDIDEQYPEPRSPLAATVMRAMLGMPKFDAGKLEQLLVRRAPEAFLEIVRSAQHLHGRRIAIGRFMHQLVIDGPVSIDGSGYRMTEHRNTGPRRYQVIPC